MADNFKRSTGKYAVGVLAGFLSHASPNIAKADDSLRLTPDYKDLISAPADPEGPTEQDSASSESKDSSFPKTRIKLSLDYLQDQQTGQREEDYRSIDSNWVKNADGYGDFLSKTKNLSIEDKLTALTTLGGFAGDNYDYNVYNGRRGFSSVSPNKIFSAIQLSLRNDGTYPTGAVCGEIHRFLADAAEKIGIPAVAFTSMTKEGPHVTLMVYDKTKGTFANIDYWSRFSTGTTNFWRALEIYQNLKGVEPFINRAHNGDGDLLFMQTSRNGERLYRFLGLDRSIGGFERDIESLPIYYSGIFFEAGNREISLSAAASDKDKEQSGQASIKLGRLFGVPGTAMSSAYIVCAKLNLDNKSKGKSLDDVRGGFDGIFSYGFLREKEQGRHAGMLRIGYRIGGDIKLDGVKIGGDLGSAMDADFYAMKLMVPINAAVHADLGKDFRLYAANQSIIGSNFVGDFLITPGDIIAGVRMKTPIGYLRLEGLEGMRLRGGSIGLEGKGGEVRLTAGAGQHEYFTPKRSIEGSAKTADVLKPLGIKSPLKVGLEVSGRWEQWQKSRDDDISVTGSLVIDGLEKPIGKFFDRKD